MDWIFIFKGERIMVMRMSRLQRARITERGRTFAARIAYIRYKDQKGKWCLLFLNAIYTIIF